MNVKIQSIHFDADRKLLDFVSERVEKLGHFYAEILGGEVYLRLDKSSDQINKIAEIRLNVPGQELFSKRQCKSFEEATDEAVEALRNQIKRHKEKASKA